MANYHSNDEADNVIHADFEGHAHRRLSPKAQKLLRLAAAAVLGGSAAAFHAWEPAPSGPPTKPDPSQMQKLNDTRRVMEQEGQQPGPADIPTIQDGSAPR